jgi:hypothetical protein
MAEFPLKNKDEWRDLICRNVSNRNSDIDVAEGSYIYVLASAFGESLAVQGLAARALARSIPLDELSEEETQKQYGDRLPQILETNSFGVVEIETAGVGTTILVGDELTDNDSKQRFVVTITDPTLYTNGQRVPVRSVDPGSGTSVAIGKRLNWSTLRSGCYAMATVVDGGDGLGIAGGRAKESLDEWHSRIRDMKANPAINENEAAIIGLIEDSTGRTLSNGQVTSGHGVSVEKGFVYPAILGTGTCGVTFLVKTDYWFRSRIPSSGDITTVLTYATNGVLPAGLGADFSLVPVVAIEQPVTEMLSISLDSTGPQWANFTPWPAYSSVADRLIISSSASATSFVIRKASFGSYAGLAQPAAGTVIGVLDASTGLMKRKTVLSVSGTGPWTITVNPDSTLSDTSFVPVTGTTVSPWSDALQQVAEAAGKSIAKMGPGEITIYPPGDGRKMKRCPMPSSKLYPIEITDRIATDVTNAVGTISGATHLGSTPYSTVPVTVPSEVSVFRMTDIGIYKR